MNTSNNILLKTPEELKLLREAGKILAEIVNELKCSFKIGITTQDIDLKAEKLMKKHNVIPAFKGYRGYPGCVCLSVNEEVVHGIPKNRMLKEGDIVSLDAGIIYKEYYSDMAVTVGVGLIKPKLQKLLDVTREALFKGIQQGRPDNHLSDISYAIQCYVEDNTFSVVKEFVGHGIGKQLHEEPEIPNFGLPQLGPVLKAGMVFAIEPMVNIGTWKTKILEDSWTVVTLDGQPSAHFEHTVAVTVNGPEILTI